MSAQELRQIVREELDRALAVRSPKGKHMTVGEVSEWLQVDEDTVRRKANHGDWPSARVGRLIRFSPEHIESIERLIKHNVSAPRSRRRKDEVAQALARQTGTSLR